MGALTKRIDAHVAKTIKKMARSKNPLDHLMADMLSTATHNAKDVTMGQVYSDLSAPALYNILVANNIMSRVSTTKAATTHNYTVNPEYAKYFNRADTGYRLKLEQRDIAKVDFLNALTGRN